MVQLLWRKNLLLLLLLQNGSTKEERIMSYIRGHLLQSIPMAVCTLPLHCLEFKDWRHASIHLTRIKILMRRDRRSTSFVRLTGAIGRLYSCWTRWLQGFPSYAILDGNGKQKLKNGNLPRKKLKRSYVNNWKPIMELMEKEVEDEICTCHVHGMDFDFLEALMTKLWKLSGRVSRICKCKEWLESINLL